MQRRRVISRRSRRSVVPPATPGEQHQENSKPAATADAPAKHDGSTRGTILLTGATGFVGSRLWTALDAAGHQVRGVTRRASRAERRWPGREWVEADVRNPHDLAGVMQGCSAAYFLVHSMGSTGGNYLREEVEGARLFA